MTSVSPFGIEVGQQQNQQKAIVGNLHCVVARMHPKPERTKSVSALTEATHDTLPAEDSSLTDEEGEAPATAATTMGPSETIKAIAEDENVDSAHMMVRETTGSTIPEEGSVANSEANSTPERSCTPTSEAKPKQKAPIKPILKPCDMEIPLKNKGWKNLPKFDMNKVRRAVSAPAASLAVDQEKLLKKSQVRFANIEVRNYDQCIGDNPACSYGTPISLDWTYEATDPIELDVYENTRGPRRKMRHMMMNYYNRRNVLTFGYGATEAELNTAEKKVNKVRQQRALTRSLLPAAKLEDFLSSAGRKAKRLGQRKNSKPSALVMAYSANPNGVVEQEATINPTKPARSTGDAYPVLVAQEPQPIEPQPKKVTQPQKQVVQQPKKQVAPHYEADEMEA